MKYKKYAYFYLTMVKKAASNNNRRKKHIILFAVLSVIILALLLSFDRILEGLVKKELESQLRKPANSLYQFRFKNLKLGVLAGNLKITGLEIMPTDSATALLESGQIKSLLHTRASSFELKDFKYLKLIRNKKMHIGSIGLSGIHSEYIINPKAVDVKRKNTSALHELFSEEFREAFITLIKIEAEKIQFRRIQDSMPFFIIDSISLRVDQILANQATLEHTIPIDFQNIRLSSGNFALNSLEDYRIKISDVDLDILDSRLTIQGFQFLPKHTRAEFSNKISFNDDLFSIRAKSITFNDLQLQEFASTELAHIHSIEIDEPEIEIYRDKRLPDAPFKYKPLLAGTIRKIPVHLLVDSLLIRNGTLTYEEQTDAGDSPGKVFFEPFYLSAYNITNDSAKIAENSEFRVDFLGNLMAAANLKASLDIDLSATNEYFTVKGSLEPVSGTAFNPMVENLLPVTIQTADVKRTEFHLSATDDSSLGQLIMEYDNLKVEVQKKDHKDKKARLISFVANGLVKSKNLPDHGNYNQGTIHFNRRKDRAIVNFLWNSIKTGIISVVAPVADPNKKFEREQKKETKKERREERKNDRN